MSKITLTPGVGKTLNSLRNLTYTNEAALADIVDNSLDAGACVINLNIDPNKSHSITIWDDGCGMDKATLVEAVRIGSNTQKGEEDLGKFGMGLVTASLSMGRKISVVSKGADGMVNKIVLDLDTISDNWEIPEVEQLTQEEEAAADLWDLLEGTGTFVTIEKLDNISPSILSDTDKHFRRVFRNFLTTKTISVNGTALDFIDPLEREYPDTSVFVDKDIDVDGHKVHVTAVQIRSDSSKANKDNSDRARCLPFSESNQGFFFVRNQREIEGCKALAPKYSKGKDGGLYKKHPETNTFRCEVSFPSSLDNLFKVSFDKLHVNPVQSVIDKLNEVTKECRAFIKSSTRRAKAVSKDDRLDHTDAEIVVRNKKNLLMASKNFSKERRDRLNTAKPVTPPKPKPDDPNQDPLQKKTRTPKKVQQTRRAMPVEFREALHGVDNNLFDCWAEGTKIIVEWNVQHPFYASVMASNKDNKNITTPIDLLIYAIAQARLSLDEDEDATLYNSFSNFMRMLSANLGVLLQ